MYSDDPVLPDLLWRHVEWLLVMRRRGQISVLNLKEGPFDQTHPQRKGSIE